MKTTVIDNQTPEALLTELRETAIAAFEKNALDAISLSAALKLSRRDGSSKPNFLTQEEITDLESRIKYLKGRLEKSAGNTDFKQTVHTTGRTIDLAENHHAEIQIIFEDKTFNATPLLHALVKDFYPEEVAQALDQSLEFMIGFLAYAGWKMDSNLEIIYTSLRKMRNGIIEGYSDCTLNSRV